MKLTVRQKKAVRKLHSSEGGAAWWRVGTGKTRIAYAFFATIAKESDAGSHHFLVVCRRAAFLDWEEETEKLGLPWRVRVIESEADLHGFYKNNGRTTIHLISHGKLYAMRDHITDFATAFEGVAYDEGFLYKNSQSARCKAANKISQMIGPAIILSGSIMTARNLEDVFGQLYAVNQHHSLGRTLTEFRSRFIFDLAIGKMGTAHKSVAKRGAASEVSRLIGDRISVYFPDRGNREVFQSVRHVQPTKRQRVLLDNLRRDYLTEFRGQSLEIRNAANLVTKCQQISDGFLKFAPVKDLKGKIIEKGKIVRLHSSKTDRLVDDVAALISQGEQVVVWCAFQESCHIVLQALQKAFPKSKDRFYIMHGSHAFDATGWRRNGLVAISTVGSGSSINHFAQVQNGIYYSHDYHWLHMQQSKGRHDRHDSKHEEIYYSFLQTYGSLDDVVHRAVHASGRKEAELITLAGIRQWLKP